MRLTKEHPFLGTTKTFFLYISCKFLISLVYQSAHVLNHVSLFANPWTACSLLGSSVHGISQARILEWVAISFFRGSSQPRDKACMSPVSCLAGRFFTTYWMPDNLIYFFFLCLSRNSSTRFLLSLRLRYVAVLFALLSTYVYSVQ